MLTIKKWLLSLTLGLFTFSVFAQKWDDSTLQTAKQQAVIAINQLINNENSALDKLLNDKERQAVHNMMQFSKGSPQTFASLSNKTIVLQQIIKDNPYNNIPYYALLLDYVEPTRHNALALALYQNILQHDEQSAPYAFNRLNRLVLAKDSDLFKKRKYLQRSYGFYLKNINVNNEQEQPEICLNFSRRVRPEPAQQWQGLVKVTPQVKGQWGYRGDSLCFNGQWKTRYQITVAAKLQSDNRLHLNKTLNEVANSGLRAPMLRFTTTGSVLNADAHRYLGIASANIDKVTVTLWQIPANNLSNSRIQDVISAPQEISSWRLNSTLTREGEKLATASFAVGDYAINDSVINNVFFADLLGKKPMDAGIYVVTIADADNPDSASAQLAFALSNTGLSAYQTNQGLWVESRNLSTTAPVINQMLTLYAKNNRILGTASTDDKGIAHFAKPLIIGEDGLQPSHIISESDGFFAYLSLQNTPIDLSDKGLAGTVNTAPLQSWIWSDRGIYRPNDTAHLMWLLKTAKGEAVTDVPVWLELLRPDGKVFLDKIIKATDSGAYRFEHYFTNSSRQGDWRVRLSMGKNGVLIAEKTLPVAALIAQQIEVAITPPKAPITANKPVKLTVQADWLYGAPASDLPAAVSYSISNAKLSARQWQDWQIGLHDEQIFSQQRHSEQQTTDAKGSSQFELDISQLPNATQPLQLTATASVNEPSGQQVHAKYQQLITRQLPYLALQAKAKEPLKVALLNQHGKLLAGQVHWQRYRVNVDYYWYKKNGYWQYQHNETRQLVDEGNLSLNTDKPGELDLPIDDGRWVIVVSAKQAPALVAASLPLEYGYGRQSASGSAPDRISITADKPRYRDGETVTLHLQAPFDGKAAVKLASDNHIIDNRLLTFKKGQATLKLTWDSAWDQGLWLLANAWNKNQQNAYNRRAVGLHWLGGDLSPYTLDITMDLPKTTVPESTLTIPLHIDKMQLADDQQTWVQVAAVDEGLYRLAKASFSNPLETFFAQQQLNLNFFDVWGAIIRQVEGRRAALRSGAGGDESDSLSALQALPQLDLQLVTFWSQPIAFDSQGNAKVTIDLPQFNGQLRIMAAAWNNNQLGAVEQSLAVKAPLVSTLYTPAYLSVGDQSQLRLRLHNTTAKPMTINAAVTAKGVSITEQNKQNQNKQTVQLAPEQSVWLTRDFQVTDSHSSQAQFQVNLSGDQQLTLKRTADIRPDALPLKTQTLTTLAANSQQTLGTAQGGRLFERQLLIANHLPFDPQSVLEQLAVYPYGCTEQITGKAWNNLLLPEIIRRYGLLQKIGEDADQRESRLFATQTQLANQQNSDGGFSLWGYGESEVWLSAYVGQFLLDAQQQQQLSNTQTLNRVLGYLRQIIMTDSDTQNARAYAHYVLAKAGANVQGATIRFAENLLSQDKTKITLSTATSHTVSALVQHGELTLATRLLQQAVQQGIDDNIRYHDYGGRLRDSAQSLAILYELQQQLQLLNLQNNLTGNTNKAIDLLWLPLRRALSQQSYYSTQDMHWLAALSAIMPNSHQPATIMLNGKALTIAGQQRITLTANAKSATTLANHGKQAVYVTVTDWVIPPADQVIENSYKITLLYEDDNGQPVNITRLKANQHVWAIATIERLHKGDESADIMFNYPLGAGLQVMTAEINENSKGKRPWYNSLKTPRFSENRDDRHLAAFYLNPQEKSFTHAFMLRAARQGIWHAPAYSVEDMYLPQHRAVYPAPIVQIK